MFHVFVQNPRRAVGEVESIIEAVDFKLSHQHVVETIYVHKEPKVYGYRWLLGFIFGKRH
jgi:hypothetical protein